MSRGFRQRWRERGSRIVRLTLSFDDIMEFALALLALSPDELRGLGWTLADRKRLLNRLLASGRQAQRVDPQELGQTRLTIRIRAGEVAKLQAFAVKELPKAASNAAMLDRALAALRSATDANDVEDGEPG